jgi:hypothetical protein
MIRVAARREKFLTHTGRVRQTPWYTTDDLTQDLDTFSFPTYYLWTESTGPRCVELDRSSVDYLIAASYNIPSAKSPLILVVPHPGFGILIPNPLAGGRRKTNTEYALRVRVRQRKGFTTCRRRDTE